MQHAVNSATEDGEDRIRVTDFNRALVVMSKYCAEDMAFEYRTKCPGLDRVILAMSGCKTEMSLKEMRAAMDRVILFAIGEEGDWELQWIRDIAEGGDSEDEMNDALCKALIKTGIIGLKRSREDRATFFPKRIPAVFARKAWFKVSPYLVEYLANE